MKKGPHSPTRLKDKMKTQPPKEKPKMNRAPAQCTMGSQYDDDMVMTYLGKLKPGGIRHGDGKSLHKNGAVHYDGNWEEGNIHGEKCTMFHDNKQKHYVGAMVSGMKEGKGAEYHPNCQLKFDGIWVEDEPTGDSIKIYNEDGTVLFEGSKHPEPKLEAVPLNVTETVEVDTDVVTMENAEGKEVITTVETVVTDVVTEDGVTTEIVTTETVVTDTVETTEGTSEVTTTEVTQESHVVAVEEPVEEVVEAIVVSDVVEAGLDAEGHVHVTETVVELVEDAEHHAHVVTDKVDVVENDEGVPVHVTETITDVCEDDQHKMHVTETVVETDIVGGEEVVTEVTQVETVLVEVPVEAQVEVVETPEATMVETQVEEAPQE